MANGYAKYSGLAGSAGGGSGTVTSVSVVSANGLAGTVATPTTTPAITLSTTVTGLLQGNGTAISAATTGNLTDAGTDGIVITGGTGAVLGSGTSLAQTKSDATHNGYLSSGDWTTFNGKQASGNYITALTGDVTATGPGSVASTLATVNGNIGTFASVTVNAKGLVTAAAALTGDGTTSSSTLTLATVNSNVGSFGSNTGIPSFTVNGKGLVTAASNNAVATVPAASTVAAWDANKNLSSNALFGSFTTTATAAGTTALTITSTQYQAFTGSTTQTVTMPTTGVAAGMSWTIYNLSTGVVTVNASGGGTIQAMAASTFLIATANAATPTTAAGWYWQYDTVDSGILPIALGGTGASSLASGAISSNGTVLSSGTLTVANGGTAKTTVTIAPTASSWAGWDANKNLSANNFLEGYTTTATAAGTTTLTVGSTFQQVFTGTTTQTIVLPVVSTLVLGFPFQIVNKSTGLLTVQSSGANTIAVVPANGVLSLTCILITGTTAASWNAYGTTNSEIYLGGDAGAGSTNTTVQRYTNIITNNGGIDLTLTQSATLGDSITINTAGLYALSASDVADINVGGVNTTWNIAKNTTTVNGSGVTDPNVIDANNTDAPTGTFVGIKLAGTTHLAVNDVIRVLISNSTGNGTTTQATNFRITRIL